MHVDHFGKQQRYQHIGIQRLHDQVGEHHVEKIIAGTELEPGDQGDRYCHHDCTNVGNDHRQADENAQRRGVIESHQTQRDIGSDADNHDFQQLAANIVSHLDVHVFPDLVGKAVFPGQEACKPGQDLFLVLEHEENQQRYHDQVDHHREQVTGRGKRVRHRLLPERNQLIIDLGDNLGHLDVGYQRVLVGQRHDFLLQLIQDIGKIPHE